MSFQTIKPHCVAFLRHVDLSDARNLHALPEILTALEAALGEAFPDPPAASSTPFSSGTGRGPGPGPGGSLSSYAFYPFSQFLQRNSAALLRSSPVHQTIFARVLQALALLTTRCQLDGGVLEQLWTFAALTLGGPLGPAAGLDATWSDVVRRATCGLLEALLQGASWAPPPPARAQVSDPMLGAGPPSETEAQSRDRHVPDPVVAHTLNALLLLAESDEHATILAALCTLHILIVRYLAPNDQMPRSLPGTLSTLCRVILRGPGGTRRGANSEVVVLALRCFREAAGAALSDTRSGKLGLLQAEWRNGQSPQTLSSVGAEETAVPTSLEAIFAAATSARSARIVEGHDEQDIEAPGSSTSATGSQVSHVTANGTAPAERPSGTTQGSTTAWLRGTAGQVHRALVSLMPVLRSHDSPLVRHEFSVLSSSLLADCQYSLSGDSVRLLLVELLVLSGDDWEEQVALPARLALDNLELAQDGVSFDAGPGTPARTARLAADTDDIAQDTLQGLPHAVFTHGIANEFALQRHLHLLIASARRHPFTAATLKMERWSRALLSALELLPVAGTGGARYPTALDASEPWRQDATHTTLLLAAPGTTANGSEHSGTARLPAYPPLKFVNTAPGKTGRLLSDAVQAVAATHGSSPASLSMLEHFTALAGLPQPGCVPTATSASALWVVAQILQALSRETESVSLQRIRRVVRDAHDLATAWLEQDNEGEAESTAQQMTRGSIAEGHDTSLLDDNLRQDASAAEATLTSVELRSGVHQLDIRTPADASGRSTRSLVVNGAVRPDSHRKRPASYDIHVRSLSLQLLGLASTLQGPSFRPHLMRLLYPLLRCLSPSLLPVPALVQAYAHCAIHQIARACGYADPGALVVDNIDYLLNAVSARLRASSGALDPMAPGVLVCAVDLAGKDVLPFLGDAVEEIFDALDRWHAYDLLVSELLRVLDRLVAVCEPEPAKASTSTSTQTNRAMHDTLEAQPDPHRDIEAFESWFSQRHADRVPIAPLLEDGQEDDFRGLPKENPLKPFGEFDQRDAVDKDDDTSGVEADPDELPPASKSQLLVLSILRKCFYFTGHPSSFLRTRVLALISTCIPLLAERSSDLLPEVHRFWPYILARLDDAKAVASPQQPRGTGGGGGMGATPAYVLLECMRLIVTLMKHKGDFMNLRVVRDVWPRLRSMLQSLEHSEHGASNAPRKTSRAGPFSAEHRIVRASIVTMRKAVEQVPGIRNDDVWEIALAFRRYLGAYQETELQEEAKKFFLSLGKVEADIVWLALQEQAGSEGLEEAAVREILASI